MERFASRYFLPSCTTATGSNFVHKGIRLHQRRTVVVSAPKPLLQRTAVRNLSSSSSNNNITVASAAAATTAELPYGLKRIDYSSLPPLTHSSKPLYTLPPPPPHLYNPKNTIFISTIQPMVAPICVAILFGSIIYLYLYPDKEVFEYWKQVERGDVPVDGEDDDDDDDDDESDEWDDDE